MSFAPFNFVRPSGKHCIITFNDGRRYHSVAYGGEGHNFMRSLEDETSSICKLVNLATEDTLTRALLFLDFDSTFSMPKLVREEYSTPDWFCELYTTDTPPDSSLILPLPRKGSGLSEDLESIETLLSIVTESMEHLLDDLRFTVEMLHNASDTFLVSLVERSVEEVAKSPPFKHRARHLKQDRIADIAKQVFTEKVMPDVEKRIRERSKQNRGTRPTGSMLDNPLKHYRVLKLWNHYRVKFQKLHDKLSCALGTELKRKDILRLLRGLSEVGTIQEVRIQGSCTNSSGNCKNYVEAYNLEYVSAKCKICKQNSMSWLIFSPIERRVRHAWRMGILPEMVVGGVLSHAPWVNEIYVREKLRLLPESKAKAKDSTKKKLKSYEVDCIIKTIDEKLILVESTSTSDQENVMNNFTDKIKLLANLKYDALFYVTPLDLKKYWPMVDKKAVLFGIRHLPNLIGHIEGAMKSKLKNPLLTTVQL